MATHRAIQTSYRGYLFRSRLEARLAIFFDYLGIKWEYEHEGYELPDGTRYLPDFWLPDFCCDDGIFVEVKGQPLSMIERRKAKLLSDMEEMPILLAVGTPAPKVYEIFEPEGDSTACFSAKYLPVGGMNGGSEYRLFYNPGYEEPDGTIDIAFTDMAIIEAVQAARSARFEHGASHPRL